MEKTLHQKAVDVASRSQDAYSFKRYRSWVAVAKALLKLGYNEDEAEGIMRSKWTRWAADAYGGRYHHTPSKAIVSYIEQQPKSYVKTDIAEFVEGLPAARRLAQQLQAISSTSNLETI